MNPPSSTDTRVIFTRPEATAHLRCGSKLLREAREAGRLTTPPEGGYYKDELDVLKRERAKVGHRCPGCHNRMRRYGNRQLTTRGHSCIYLQCRHCGHKKQIRKPLLDVNGQPLGKPTPTQKVPIKDRDGYTLAEVASKLGITPEAVSYRAKCLNLKLAYDTIIKLNSSSQPDTPIISPSNFRKIQQFQPAGGILKTPNGKPLMVDNIRCWPTSRAWKIAGLKNQRQISYRIIGWGSSAVPGRVRACPVESSAHGRGIFYYCREDDLLAIREGQTVIRDNARQIGKRLQFDPATRTVKLDGAKIRVRRSAFRLLRGLASLCRARTRKITIHEIAAHLEISAPNVRQVIWKLPPALRAILRNDPSNASGGWWIQFPVAPIAAASPGEPQVNGHTAEGPEAKLIESNDRQPPKRRGRPLGKDREVAQRKQAMLDGWDQGKYQSRAEAARAHGFHRPDASKMINEHERRNNSDRG